LAAALLLVSLAGCGHRGPEPGAVTMLLESSPTNLDPRVGADEASAHIDELIFDYLVRKDEHYNPQPSLATSWDIPDPLTYVFHLQTGVRFHDGRPLTSRDVKWTLDSVHNGTLVTTKGVAMIKVDHIDTPDAATVIVHLKKPDPFLLLNVSDGAIGIVPYRSGRDFSHNPVGSGPFVFVSQTPDKEVVLKRNDHWWRPLPAIRDLRFDIVPDAITRALELQKGSADIAASRSLTADMVNAIQHDPHTQLDVQISPGSVVQYMTFNMLDPELKDQNVRQAIAYALNRPLIIASLFRGEARSADSLLPPGNWARATDLPQYAYDPAKANALLDAAHKARGPDGIRFHLKMKTSTDEMTRLLALVIAQQLRQVGIALDVRSYEFATFYSDISKGAFSTYMLRWVGGNESPDIFHSAYSVETLPPHGNNRGRYVNAELDRLLNDATNKPEQADRREDYVKVQQILSNDLPTIPLWYLDNVIVHSRRLQDVHVTASGDYSFLTTAKLADQ
jgi:peptide/nickel transport system substrate-binding protein